MSVTPTPSRRHARLLDGETLAFLAQLHHRFEPRRRDLLEARLRRQAELDDGGRLDFLPETRAIRDGTWTVTAPPADLADRRVEITGPPDRRRMVHALNSGARCFMADFEDALSPTWENLLDGQVNIADAAAGHLQAADGEGRPLVVQQNAATLLVRPRGWHLVEHHVVLDGQPMSASLFDVGVFLAHGAQALLRRGSGPYLYLPKLESHREAQLWNDVLVFCEEWLGIPRNSVRPTVLIETLPAAFEMEEILHALRERSPALNAGRWDYLFSVIKCTRSHPRTVLPDRTEVTMASPFMAAYAELLVQTCHKRGAYAIGGMSAYVPSRREPERNRIAFAQVQADKVREARQGFDGTWVAHPDLVTVALHAFEEVLGPRTQQLDVHPARHPAQADLTFLQIPGSVTERGLRNNARVTIAYLAAWLSGTGAVALDGLMEDTATAEIARAQVWQWIRQGVVLEDGRTVNQDLVSKVAREELGALRSEPALSTAMRGRLDEALGVFERLAFAPDLDPFLTLVVDPERGRMPAFVPAH